jgi:RNA polymerase sigma-70 factor (ECF subfamily)
MSVLLGDEFARVLAAAQAGEEWAVARLYRSLQPALLRYLTARDPQDAEDIAAQVWLEVARALSKFEGVEDGFRAYVFTIARRRMLNARRGRARRRADCVPMETLVGTVRAKDDPAEETAARIDGAAAVRRIVALLSPEQADIVLLRVVGRLSVEEVATMVGKRASTVRVIQHRALRRLARELGEDA